MKQDDINRAISLSLIHKSEAEAAQLHNEVEKILAFVQEIQKIETIATKDADKQVNVFRDDVVTVPAGSWREKLLAQAPAQFKNWIVTKKIL